MRFEIDAEEEFLDYIIPKLILQPIAENALYHGIKNKGTMGTISICVFQDEENLVITVTDDGIGISENQVEQLNESLLQRKPSIDRESDNGYGIMNVNERIKIYFGEQYGLFYVSEYQKFTTVYVSLPMLKSEGQINGLFRERTENDTDINSGR